MAPKLFQLSANPASGKTWTIKHAPPGPASSLSATTTSDTTIYLAWSPSSSVEVDNYYIQQSSDGINFSTVSIVSAVTINKTISGLTASTLYYFWILAFSTNYGFSVPSNTDSATTSSGSSSLPSGIELQLEILPGLGTTFQGLTGTGTAAGTGDTLGSVVAATGQVFAFPDNASRGTLRADGAELQVYNSSTMPTPYMEADTPWTAAGDFTIYLVGTWAQDDIWATDGVYSWLSYWNHFGQGSSATNLFYAQTDNDMSSILGYTIGTGSTFLGGNDSHRGVRPHGWLPLGEFVLRIRRESGVIRFQGTGMPYDDDDTTNKEWQSLLNGTTWTGTFRLGKIGFAFLDPNEDYLSMVNNSTTCRYRAIYAYGTALGSVDDAAVKSYIADTHGISFIQLDPITPSVPDTSGLVSPPAELSRPLFNPHVNLSFVGGCRVRNANMPNIGVQFLYGGLALDRDGSNNLRFYFISGSANPKVARCTLSSALSSSSTITDWPLLSLPEDLGQCGTRSADWDVSQATGIYVDGTRVWVSGVNAYYGSVVTTDTNISSQDSPTGGTNFGDYRIGTNIQRTGGGFVDIPAWFQTYTGCGNFGLGCGGYYSGQASTGGTTLYAVNKTDTPGTILPVTTLIAHGAFNGATADKERRNPDYVEHTNINWGVNPEVGGNGYMSDDACKDIAWLDDSTAHGHIVLARWGYGRSDYNRQNETFFQAVYGGMIVYDPAQLAAVAKGLIGASEVRGYFHRFMPHLANTYPVKTNYVGQGGPIGIALEPGAGAGGTTRVYFLMAGTWKSGSTNVPTIEAYDVV